MLLAGPSASSLSPLMSFDVGTIQARSAGSPPSYDLNDRLTIIKTVDSLFKDIYLNDLEVTFT